MKQKMVNMAKQAAKLLWIELVVSGGWSPSKRMAAATCSYDEPTGSANDAKRDPSRHELRIDEGSRVDGFNRLPA